MGRRGLLRSVGIFVAVIVSQFGSTFTSKDERQLVVTPGPGGGGPIFQLESALAESLEAEAIESELHPIRHHHGIRRNGTRRLRRQHGHHHALESQLHEEAMEALHYYRRPQRRHLADNFPGRVYVVGSSKPDGSEDSGPWGPWSEPSECSRSCGGGIASQTRSCLEADNSGASRCVGGLKRYFSCNIQDCPEPARDFRSQQCSQYDDVNFEGQYYRWIPYTKAPNRCELNCMPRGERFYYRHKRKVIDGTRCDEEKLDICVDGECLPVGCDMVLGSDAKEDQCRECGGDGSGCHTVKDLIRRDDLVVGYNDILLIPAGATNILVRELEASNNYLAVRNTTNHYYLNGNWRIDFPRDLRFAGTVFHYERRPHGFYAPESIKALGPTTEAIYIVLLYQEKNPGVQYEYSVPKGVSQQTDPDSYTWLAGEFSECSATCGGGFMTRPVMCVRRRNTETVPDDLCDPGSRLPSNNTCAEDPCPPKWVTGEWGQCSETCAGANETGGIRTRKVHCEQTVSGGLSAIVADSACIDGEAGEQPLTSEPCNQDIVCPVWYIGPWKPCDRLCGAGKHRRKVLCYRKIIDESNGKELIEILSDDSCPVPKPDETKPCMRQPCEGVDWIVTEWSGCENKCGLAKETRQAHCSNLKGKIYPPERCHSYRLPVLERKCKALAPCEYNWYASQWSECSAPCGKGVKTRDVFCAMLKDFIFTKVEDDKCDLDKKYPTEEECIGKDGAQCKGQWFSGPWSKCPKDCGGGVMTRTVLCIAENKTVDFRECDANTVAFSSETCNNQACGADQIMPVEPTHGVDEEDECEEDEDFIETTLGLLGSTGTPTEDRPGTTLTESTVTATTGGTEVLTTGSTESEGTVTEGSTTTQATTTGGTITEETVTEETVTEGTTTGKTATEETTTAATVTEEGTTTELTTITQSTDSEATDTTLTESTTESVTTVTEETSTAASTVTVTTEYDSTDTTASETVTTTTSEGTTATTTEVSDSSDTTVTSVTDTTPTEVTDTTPTEVTDTTVTDETETTPTEGTRETSVTDTTVMDTTTESITTETTTSDTTITTTTEGPTTTVESTMSTESSSEEDESAEKSHEPLEVTEGEFGSGYTESEDDDYDDESFWQSDPPSSPDDVLKLSTLESSATDEELKKTTGDMTSTFILTTSTGDTTPTDGDLTKSTPDVTDVSSKSTPDFSDVSVKSTPDFTDLTGSTAYSLETIYVTSAVSKEQKVKKCKRKKKPARETVKSCKDSEFGCCSDGVTNAKGPFGKGCLQPETCEDTKFGCCTSDDVTPAEGPKQVGCPPSQCSESLFGCCPDGISSAEGNNFEGCKEEEIVPFYCQDTEFKCCPDGLTAATGPNMAGCFVCEGSGECDNCNDTRYGCCPDMVTPATGPDGAGCDDTMEGSGEEIPFTTESSEPPTSTYGCYPDDPDCFKQQCESQMHGCCDDGITAAHGPNKEGCCLNTTYGCCPDNILAAQGPNLEGCGCQYSPYRCCPDNETAARGPNKEGCGCQYTTHGCCPDRYTPASGPNYMGCPCHTYQFGCCPDGFTISKGPHRQGCGCQNSEFGCCSDEKTPKTSATDECGCEASKHGCCPDGVTPANGDKFEGCDDVPVRAGEMCTLAKDRGPCREFTVKWFFDMDYGGCSRFWYGGCHGNANRFKSQGECQQTCVEPKGRDACFLPKVEGPCDGYYPTWYYDAERKQCGQFVYGGCLGNNNKFQTMEECEELCVIPDNIDACDQPVVEGPCRGNYSRWYYDQSDRMCKPFTYGGCKGNDNNFHTEKACHQQCLQPGRTRVTDICALPKDTGPCPGSLLRWYYDSTTENCRQFMYGGCQGNPNRFRSEDECRSSCHVTLQRELCALPRAQGDCKERLPRWFFDGSENRCMPFYYSGCDGNANQFETQSECEETCPPKIELDTCMLPALVGECRNYTTRWYYDSYELRCRRFYYGGCGGNHNNFNTLEDCQSRCSHGHRTEPPAPEFRTEYCFYPEDSGPCSQASEKWFYDRHDGVCKPFTYGGCQGNNNRFDNRQDCEHYCGNSQDICELPKVVGPCSGSFQQWFYDRESDYCYSFDYGGCQGNKNRFNDRESCEQRCQRRVVTEPPHQLTHLPVTEGPPRDDRDICNAPLDAGQCPDSSNSPDDDHVITAWYYEASDQSCRAFSFFGCAGNANRFATEEQCERQCGQFKGLDVCASPGDPGPCRGRFVKWFFDSITGACREFIYGGCQGNGNRFSSSAECESVCHLREELLPSGNDTSISHQAVCRQPVNIGPCSGSYKRWYFDEDRRTCIPFIYGGCAGNQNRFANYETCRRFCSVLLGVGENEIDSSDKDCSEIRERCNELQCAYGVERSVDEKDCETCRCHNPCEDHYCEIPGHVCVVELYYPGNADEAQFRGICKPASKSGHCPPVNTFRSQSCGTECRTDSDCNEQAKCCYNGCGHVCVLPATEDELLTEEPPRPPAPHHEPTTSVYEEPARILPSDIEVTAEEGSYATLRCIAIGRPTPTVVWRKNIDIIDGSDARYHLLVDGSLQIIGLTKNDAGIYTCFATNDIGNPAKQDYRLVVTTPASSRPADVLGDEVSYVVVALSAPTTLHCRAIGWPAPSITWWRGERMLPLSSNRYEQRRDMTLLLRSVGLQDLGPYTCQAYNGVGRAASWTITLQSVGPVAGLPPNSPYAQYLITPPSRERPVERPRPRPRPRPVEPPPTQPPRLPEVIPPQGPPYGSPVPLRANITLQRTTYPVSSDITVKCQIEGYPIPRIAWYKDDVQLETSERIQLADPNTLLILRANTTDSGTYKCEATNPYGFSSSSVTIHIEGAYVHPNCTDNPYFANCALIVKAHYCTHKYYARFCCRSCTLAGQLPSHGPHLEGHGISFGSGRRQSNKRK